MLTSQNIKALKDDLRKTNPNWFSLTEKEQQIVSDIASQLPMRCEDVAAIFIKNGRSIIQTTRYIKMKYGFTVF